MKTAKSTLSNGRCRLNYVSYTLQIIATAFNPTKPYRRATQTSRNAKRPGAV